MSRRELFPKPGADMLPDGFVNTKTMLRDLKRTGDIFVPEIDFARYKAASDYEGLKRVYNHDLKPARNTLIAFFLEDITSEIDEVRKRYPPFGLAQIEYTEDKRILRPVETIDTFTSNFTLGSIDTWGEAVDLSYNPLSSWVRTIPEEQLLHLDPDFFDLRKRMFAKLWYTTTIASQAAGAYADPKLFMSQGVGTASRFSAFVTELGARVYKRDLYDETLPLPEQIEKMSDYTALYPLTVWVADMHMQHGARLFNSLIGNPPPTNPANTSFSKLAINPDDFEYRIIEGKRILVPRPNSNIQILTDKEGNVIFKTVANSVRTGCPAIPAEISLTDDSVVNIIKYQLIWSTEVAKQTLIPQMLAAH